MDRLPRTSRLLSGSLPHARSDVKTFVAFLGAEKKGGILEWHSRMSPFLPLKKISRKCREALAGDDGVNSTIAVGDVRWPKFSWEIPAKVFLRFLRLTY